MNENEIDIIDLGQIARTLFSKRKTFFIVWVVTFALSVLWILPQPRYYSCDVKLAPESGDEKGGLSSIASSFGFNLGSMASSDAIYPMLYPDLFESPEFIAELLNIQVVSDDETIKTDYYTYLRKHQKKNWLTRPFVQARITITELLSTEPKPTPRKNGEQLDPFKMNKIDYDIVQKVQENITCIIDKKTDVITINVKDQDRQICALLADSVKVRLQAYIIDYRTKKVRQDVEYYQQLTDNAKQEYEEALMTYGSYNDGHRNVTMQTYVEYSLKLKNDMETKLQTYNTFNAQLATAKAKVQERTPSFTTLKSATVPQKPAGPKRLRFTIGMLFIASVLYGLWTIKDTLFGKN